MQLKLIEWQNTRRLRQYLTIAVAGLNFVFLLVSILTLSASNEVLLTVVAALWFFLLGSLLFGPILRQSPIFLIVTFFSTLYFSVPILALLLLKTDYQFGAGLVLLPYEQDSYHDNVSVSIFTLCLFHLVIAAAILLGSFITRTKALTSQFSGFFAWKLLLGMVCVISVSAFSAFSILQAALHHKPPLLTFLGNFFMDTAFMSFVMLSVARSTKDQHLPRHGRSGISLVLIVFLAFISLFVLSGSKGSVQSVVIFMFILPIALLNDRSIYIPAPTVFSAPIFLMLALLLFSLGDAVRVSYFADNYGLFEAMHFSLATFVDLITRVVYRLGWSGFDRFVLLLSTELNDGFLFSTRLDFVTYQLKNLINLLLPGTPYKDALAPSSQLFEQVIGNREIGWVGREENLVRSFNTQAFTLAGTAVVYLGSWSFIFVFIFIFGLQMLYSAINKLWFRLSLLYLVVLVMPTYGLETSIQLVISFFISCQIYALLLKGPVYRGS